MNEDTEDKLTLWRAVNLMKETNYAPIFETFTHMINQDYTKFADKFRSVISLHYDRILLDSCLLSELDVD